MRVPMLRTLYRRMAEAVVRYRLSLGSNSSRESLRLENPRHADMLLVIVGYKRIMAFERIDRCKSQTVAIVVAGRARFIRTESGIDLLI